MRIHILNSCDLLEYVTKLSQLSEVDMQSYDYFSKESETYKVLF